MLLENWEGLGVIDMKRNGKVAYILSINRGTYTEAEKQMPLPLA